MNSDSFRVIRSDYPSTHPFFPAVLSLTSTTETAISFANTTGPAVAAIPLQTDILGSNTPTDPNANNSISSNSMGRPGAGYRGSAPYFSSGSFDGRAFLITAQYKFTVVSSGGGASVWTPKLYRGTSATIGSDNLVFAATGISVPASHTANGSAFIQATVIWDSVSGLLTGEGVALVQAFDVTAAGAITPVYTSRAATSSIAAAAPVNLQFLTSITIATTAPTSSSTTLTELSISQL
jgi:hypothetical protein